MGTFLGSSKFIRYFLFFTQKGFWSSSMFQDYQEAPRLGSITVRNLWKLNVILVIWQRSSWDMLGSVLSRINGRYFHIFHAKRAA